MSTDRTAWRLNPVVVRGDRGSRDCGKEGSDHVPEADHAPEARNLNERAPVLVIEYVPSEPEPARFHVKPGADRPALAKCKSEGAAQAYVALRCS